MAVRFRDKPNQAAIRAQHLPSHLEWLRAHAKVVLVAGALREAEGAAPVGGLWVVDAPSPEAVYELLQSDPFWRAGLRESVEVLLWSKALPDLVATL